jgi:hypothetical protein
MHGTEQLWHTAVVLDPYDHLNSHRPLGLYKQEHSSLYWPLLSRANASGRKGEALNCSVAIGFSRSADPRLVSDPPCDIITTCA